MYVYVLLVKHKRCAPAEYVSQYISWNMYSHIQILLLKEPLSILKSTFL